MRGKNRLSHLRHIRCDQTGYGVLRGTRLVPHLSFVSSRDRKVVWCHECSVPLHMFGLQPMLHECCGPLGSTLRRRLSKPDGSHSAGFVITSWNKSVSFLSCVSRVNEKIRRYNRGDGRTSRIVEIKIELELDKQRNVVCPAALRFLTARTMAGC